MILPSKEEMSILWKVYLSSFIFQLLSVFYPFMVVYFRYLEFSMTQIGIIMAVFPLAMVLFEVPTGAVADLFGRKFSVILGIILSGITYLAIYFTKDYYGLIALFIALGFSTTLTSGSYEAWIVDHLKDKKKNKLIKNYFIHRYSITNIGLLISGVIGALVVLNFGLRTTILVSSIGLFLSALILFWVKENYKPVKYTGIINSYKRTIKQIKDSLKYAYYHKIVFYIILCTIFINIAYSFAGTFSWVPLLQEAGLKEHYFGYLWSLTALSGIIAPILVKKYVKNDSRALTYSYILEILYFILLIPMFGLEILVIFYITKFVFLDFQNPIWHYYMQRYIPSKKRATVTSIDSMISGLTFAIFLALAGFLIDKVGSKITILIGGIFLLPTIYFLFKIRRNEKSVKKHF